MKITGLDGSGNTLVSEEDPIIVSNHPRAALEPGGDVFIPGCSWVCNGSYYAWEIKQYVNEAQPTAGPSILQVRTALNFNASTEIATPNYRYITDGEYDQHCPNGVGSIVGIACNEPSGLWIVGPIDISQSTTAYPDISGNPTQGPLVYGVGKPLGDWGGGQPITTPELMFGNTVCGNETWWAMGMVNNNAPAGGYPMDGTGNNFYPDLTCNQLVSGGVGDPDVDHEFGEPEFLGELLDWLEDQNEDDGSGGKWDNFVKEVVKRAMDDPTIGNGLSWHELIDGCIIRNLNDPLAAVINVNPNDPSTFISGFTVQPGLYNFGFAIKDLGYTPFISEVEKKLNVSMTMADLLSVNIYPVPISDNKFSIDMTASDVLKFTYEFRNDSGVLLYTENFNLKKGQQWTHVMEPKQGVPNGMHINRFVFGDGSTLVLQTIK